MLLGGDGDRLWEMEKAKKEEEWPQSPRIEPAGGKMQFDYHDPVSIGIPVNNEKWFEFWYDLTRFMKQTMPGLGRFIARRITISLPLDSKYTEEATDVSPFLDLSKYDSFEEMLAECGSSHRSNVRRRLRKAEKNGEVILQRIKKEDIASNLEMMFHAHIEQWHQQGGIS